MAVSKRLRFEILRRDNHACRYCGASAPEAVLVVDHVIPETLGGLDDPSNLVAACEPCNQGKSSVPAEAAVVEDVAQDALRWARAIQKANELADVERQEWSTYCEEFLAAWNRWGWTDSNGVRQHVELPGVWRVKVVEYGKAGLSLTDMREAVDIAQGTKYADDTFAYFGGVARQRIATRQSVAAELIRRGLVE